MKRFGVLVLVLLVGGCVLDPMTANEDINPSNNNWKLYNPDTMDGGRGTTFINDGVVRVFESSQDGFWKSRASKIYYRVNTEEYSIDFKTALPGVYERNFKNACKLIFKTKNKIHPFLRTIVFNSNSIKITQEANFKVICYKPGEYENILAKSQERARIISKNEKIEKCKKSGLWSATFGLEACVEELVKQEKLMAEKVALEKERQRISNEIYLKNKKLLEEQKRQNESQALINIGAALLGQGTSRPANPSSPSSSNQNAYSSTLTVPSNQVCPLLSSPITKQEVRGVNRICYYQ